MHLMTKTITLLICLTFTFSSMAQDIDFSQMTESEKQTTGIDKLSADEQDALKRWIEQKQKAFIVTERKKTLGLENKMRGMDENIIKARLVKKYRNKIGDTFYQLSNGQIWKQLSTGRITVDSEGIQIITIEPGFMGSWTMSGEGNRSVKVKRIK